MTDTAYVIMCYTPGDEPEIFSDVDSVALTEEAAKREVAERTAALRKGSLSYYAAVSTGVVGDPTEDEQRRERIADADELGEKASDRAVEMFGMFGVDAPGAASAEKKMIRGLYLAFLQLRAELKGLGY